MIAVGDTVMVGSRIGGPWSRGTVVDIIPSNDYREALYRVRFHVKTYPVAPTITPNPSESWVDAGIVYGPFVDQDYGWNDSDK